MSSLNSNFSFSNWFSKPPNPSPLLLPDHLRPTAASSAQPFASISSSSLPANPSKDPKSPSSPPFDYSAWVDRFFWECENRPNYRHTPEVEWILNDRHPLLEARPDATPEDISANDKWWKDFRSHPFIKFLQRAEEITDQINEQELRENRDPYRREDRDYWRSIPHVKGLDGRPMPRKAIKTRKESDDKFWDFMKQFLFGLWGFRQRPYPPGKPIDVAQAIGYKRLEKRYYDCKFVTFRGLLGCVFNVFVGMLLWFWRVLGSVNSRAHASPLADSVFISLMQSIRSFVKFDQLSNQYGIRKGRHLYFASGDVLNF